jgi:iron complex outermembrane receptor protein
MALRVAHEDLNPYIRNTKGHRGLLAIAMDWRLKPGTVIDFEFEQSHREQIGINGYSLLGGVLPAPVDPRINLTRQAWSQPGVFDAMTGSVRVRQELDAGWRWTTQYGAQRLKTDDRLTYGFGCSAISDYSQFCADGSFDLYDFRSENERRLTDALQTEIAGKLQLGQLQHELTFGFSRQRQLDRMPPMQSYNYNNTPGSVFTPFNSSASPNYVTPNTNRSEYSTELSIKDRVQLSDTTSVWAGLRNVSYNRSSVQNEHTDQTVQFPYPDLYPNAKQFTGSINVPWIGVSTRMVGMMTYASHGHGVEQFVTPNTASFGPNAGTQLGIGRSRQTEFGLRSLPSTNQLEWNAAVFQVSRPYAHDLFDGPNYSTRYIDGKQTHQGLDLGATWRNSAWKLSAQTQWLHAKLTDVQQSPETVGSTPLNIPRFVLRGMAEYRYASAPGLRTGLRVSHEGKRNVTEDGGVMLPSWTTFAASAHYDTKVNNIASTWTLAIDNLEDKRYWRESPKQFGHYYLYPGAPRTIRATVLFRL